MTMPRRVRGVISVFVTIMRHGRRPVTLDDASTCSRWIRKQKTCLRNSTYDLLPLLWTGGKASLSGFMRNTELSVQDTGSRPVAVTPAWCQYWDQCVTSKAKDFASFEPYQQYRLRREIIILDEMGFSIGGFGLTVSQMYSWT
jgi:hypothetical protein